MTIPHPIPYQGSKRNLANKIIGLFPEDTTRLVEPFAGSAAISLAAGYNGRASSFVLNDINKPLMDLWSQIIYNPKDVSSLYEKLWHQQLGTEKEFYLEIRDKFNTTHRPEYFLYLLARCVKGSVRYNSNGEFNQSPDNRRKGARPETMKKNIFGASKIFGGKTKIHTKDYKKIFDYCEPSDVIYMDPPYQGVCGERDQRYLPNGFSYSNFIESLEWLNERGMSYIISYDGRTGDKAHGEPLPKSLNLKHIEVKAGRSTQATLLGRKAYTYESIYLSPALIKRPIGLIAQF